MKKIRVFTMFSGYDSQCMALDKLKEMHPEFDYELVGWAEIDKYAIQAHNAVYPQWEDRNYGDVSKINWSEVPDFDLLTYSSPCQDFSNAGLQRGGQEGSGTRSSLLWECRRAIATKKPKYLMMENVAALVSQKFISTFNQWQLELESYGYTNFSQVLNAKDYGVPQNRERIFMISILNCDEAYYFPKKIKLTKRLKDVLEDNVDEKYYLSDKTLEGFAMHNERHQAKGTGFLFEPTDGGGTAKCLRANAALAPTDNAIIDTKPIGGGQNDPVVLGWTRDHKGNIIDRHPVEVANCVTAAKRDNTSNYVVERNEPINVDEEGNAKCLRAGYFKAGAANFKEREDGFAQTAVKVNNEDEI
jgi:DNA (cytosine-5)-methyltransferase 1